MVGGSRDSAAQILDKGTHVETLTVDQQNYKAYIADRKENGGWTQADVAEYRAEVERIMKSGTDDEKAAASEFWAVKARIRQSLTADTRRAAA